MEQGCRTHQSERCCLSRVLVVDNNPMDRADHVKNMTDWGYQAVVADGYGEALLEDARHKAREYRCHVAVVDMRLLDDHDRSDTTGLDLVSGLGLTRAIIVTAYGTSDTATQALTEKGAVNFVGKAHGPERLRQAIERALNYDCSGCRGAALQWPEGLSPAEVAELLIPGDPHVPAKEAECLIGQLFKNAREITLEPIAGVSDVADGQRSAFRRHSIILKAAVDGKPAPFFVKLARANRTKKELENYRKYVPGWIPGAHHPVVHDHAHLWDMGAIAYEFRGTPGTETFAARFGQCRRATELEGALGHFFGPSVWQPLYTAQMAPLTISVFEAHDQHWDGALSEWRRPWRREELFRPWPALSARLPNPRRWLAENHAESAQIDARQAVIHGDLHGDNLFVDRTGRAFPIDYERTGPGPFSLDFAELSQDIVTRLAPLDKEMPIQYDLAVALCAPHSTRQRLRPTVAIMRHPGAHLAFRLLQQLNRLAHRIAGHMDYREYLWSLLLDSLYVCTLVPADDPRYERSLLLASVACGRLERWGEKAWPPPDWPPVIWQPTGSRRS